jgi:hypothetical protein
MKKKKSEKQIEQVITVVCYGGGYWQSDGVVTCVCRKKGSRQGRRANFKTQIRTQKCS